MLVPQKLVVKPQSRVNGHQNFFYKFYELHLRVKKFIYILILNRALHIFSHIENSIFQKTPQPMEAGLSPDTHTINICFHALIFPFLNLLASTKMLYILGYHVMLKSRVPVQFLSDPVLKIRIRILKNSIRIRILL